MTKQQLFSLLNCLRRKTCIDSVLQHTRTLVLMTKSILPLFVSILFLTFSPLLSIAKLIPSKTLQLSLIVQTASDSEKDVDVPKMKKAEAKKMMKMKEKKEYKDEKSIRILDPTEFNKSQANRIYSGPQPGEKLPPLKVTYLYEENDGKPFDIVAETKGRPFILFIQDNNVASIKGMDHNIEILSQIAQYQKEQTEASDAENPNQDLKIGIVFLLDEANALPDWSEEFLKNLETSNVKVCESPDGREGPGSYGLNRNVAQTILIAKEGKVLYNFPFTQPAFYADPHVLGAVTHAINAEPAALEKWLNDSQKKRDAVKRLDEKSLAAEFSKIRESVLNGKKSKEDAAEWMQKLGITWEEGEKLLKDKEDTSQMMKEKKLQDRDPSPEERIRRDGDKRVSPESKRMDKEDERDRDRISPEALIKRFDKDGDGKLNEAEKLTARREMSNRENQNRDRRRNIEVKNPDEFKKNRELTIYSGPQPKEKLPSLKAIAINGDVKGKTIDFTANTNKKPFVLILQDEKPLGLRGLVGFTRLITQISKKSEKEIKLHVVFLGDSPDALAQQASKIVPHIPKNVLLGISPDGREGPGNYGLNRNVAQTILTIKDGKVLHNFALAQPMLASDPYVLGAVAELIGQKPATLQKWLNERPAESERMKDQSEEKNALGRRLREMIQKGEITPEEARKRYEKAFPSDEED